MTPCHVVQIETPKKYLLNGLWFGPKYPKRVIVWVHGLGSSAFSMGNIAHMLPDGGTAVLAFNNRGHDVVANLSKKSSSSEKKPKRILAGAAHEKFADCVDDIQGAVNFARSAGVKNVFIAGHSTGCQKSIYWAHKKKMKGVKGIILLAPVNDYAGALAWHGRARVLRATKFARALVKRGRPHELLPASIWNEEGDDAQRFLSLYTPDSAENIFPYNDPKKNPRILRSVKGSLLVLWAGKDEYADRPAEGIAGWFKTERPAARVVVVPDVGHSFKGGETSVLRAIKNFIDPNN